MSLINTLVNGHEGGLKHEGMTPMQKIALRFIVLGVLYYGVSAIEGMMMRMVAITPVPLIDYSRFFSVMTAHPMVGILGSTYMIVFGIFLFVVPFLMIKANIHSEPGQCNVDVNWRGNLHHVAGWISFLLCSLGHALLATSC